MTLVAILLVAQYVTAASYGISVIILAAITSIAVRPGTAAASVIAADGASAGITGGQR